MKDLTWIGIRESEIKYSDCFSNSISIFGDNDISLQKQIQKRINHNDYKHDKLIGTFYSKEVIRQVRKKQNVIFMCYSQIYNYNNIKRLGLLDHVLCLNDQDLVEFADSKFRAKEYLKTYIPVLDYTYIRGKDYDFEKIKQKYGSDTFVAQTEKSSGGFGTIILDEHNQSNIKLENNSIYMLTKYCKDSIPINLHILISQNDIVLLPPSIQIIEISFNRLVYKGSDFIAYRENINDMIDSKVKEYAFIIGKLLQERGYRGILGVDSIIYDDKVYFMEINPRFQNSSTIINRSLRENDLPSLQELHLNCFLSKNITLKTFEVDYSSYINEYGAPKKDLEINPLEKLDNPSKRIAYEKHSYLSTDLYNNQIFGVLRNYSNRE